MCDFIKKLQYYIRIGARPFVIFTHAYSNTNICKNQLKTNKKHDIIHKKDKGTTCK